MTEITTTAIIGDEKQIVNRRRYNMENNEMLRKMARDSGVYLWEIGEHLGVSENTVIRWLRKPLDQSKEKIVFSAISSIAELKGKGVS